MEDRVEEAAENMYQACRWAMNDFDIGKETDRKVRSQC